MNDYCSVVMVTCRKGKNDRQELARISIDSLLRNTYNKNVEELVLSGYPFEFILIDNTQNNRTLGAARNLGISQATGKYIAIVDDDIKFFPQWLADSIKILEGVPGKIITTPVHVDRSRPWWKKHYMGLHNGYIWHTRSGSNCMVMTRESLDDIGLFLESGKWSGVAKVGVEWHDRLNKKGYKVLLTAEHQVYDMGFKKHSY